MSMEIETNVPLAPYTTLGVGGPASHFITVRTIEALKEACAYAQKNNLRVKALGGGSNVLVSDRGVDALVVHLGIADREVREDGETVYITVGSGAVLDEVIVWAVENGWWGMENLSAIPGSVGAVPIQNVGAYGVEAKDVVDTVHAYDPYTRKDIDLTVPACRFGYRDSIFKQEAGKHLIVTGVTFRLSRTPNPRITYKDLALRFGEAANPVLSDIRNAVIEIRSGKFPDWHVLGTAGSFFKNPIIPESLFNSLKEKYPEMPGFKQEEGIKVPLGWILDKVLHVRGYREGAIGLYEQQALVLVNYGGATSEEICAFSDAIIKKIFDATSIVVEREVVLFA